MTPLGPSSTRRRLALGGIVGPTAFVTTWVVGAFANDRQLSVVDDAISQLAHVDSNTRGLMTAGFVTFGVGVGLFAVSVRSTLGTPASALLGATAASTLAVASLPLGVSDIVDRLHGIAAAAGYVTLAAAPIAARGSLQRLGASHALPANGAFQRVGLTVVDAWIVTVAVLVITGPSA